MAGFFIVFATFKLIALREFAEAFYDRWNMDYANSITRNVSHGLFRGWCTSKTHKSWKISMRFHWHFHKVPFDFGMSLPAFLMLLTQYR
jgi:hypothetical protein